jgi:ligand-binding sensor protein
LANCMRSDAIVGRFNKVGPTIQPCLSGGLWDTGTSISVGNTHIATWLIGQVMNEEQDIRKMMDYARQIEADVDEFSRALSSVKVMDKEKFVHISEALFLFSSYLSAFAESMLENKPLDGSNGRNQLIAIIEKEPDLAQLYPVWDEMQTLFNYSVH